MKCKVFIGLSAALLGLALGCENANKSKPTEQTYEENILEQKVQTVTATVDAIDQDTRHVTLRGEDGSILSFRAGEPVRNLPQVKVGDKVKVQYYEATAGRLLRPGETPPAEPTEETDTIRSPEGTLPGVATRRKLSKTATITNIDENAPSVTIKDQTGITTMIRVRDTSRLSEIKVGDQVIISFTEGVAVSVEPAD